MYLVDVQSQPGAAIANLDIEILVMHSYGSLAILGPIFTGAREEGGWKYRAQA